MTSMAAGTAIAFVAPDPEECTMYSLLSSIIALLVSGLAGADELERSIPAVYAVDEELAPAEVVPDPHPDLDEPGDASCARALEARVGDVVDRSTELAAERAMAVLEARVAERLDEVEQSTSRRVEQQFVHLSDREGRGGELEGELAAVWRREADAIPLHRRWPVASTTSTDSPSSHWRRTR